MKAIHRVGTVVDLVGSYGRNILVGVSNYAFAHHWELLTLPLWSFDQQKAWKRWKVDGLIVQVYSPDISEMVKAMAVPAVNVSGGVPDSSLPTVAVDNLEVGRQAARHLLALGFRRFAFTSGTHVDWARLRGLGFSEVVLAAEASCGWDTRICQAPPGCSPMHSLRDWLQGTLKPAAIFTANDRYAMEVMDLCRQLDLAIPEQVAVLGAGDDELLARLAAPSLSSIAIPADKIAYQAATLLDQLLDGHEVPLTPLLLPPSGVVERRSTDTIAIHDADVAAALRFIRENAHLPIGVPDILARVPLARRSLERRFQVLLGRTPHEEILRTRLQRACHLLVSGDLPIAQIARLCGFAGPTRFAAVFSKEMGLTPSAYREQAKTKEPHTRNRGSRD